MTAQNEELQMMRKRIFLLLLSALGVLILTCGLFIWALNSPLVDDYYWLYRRDTESDLALAFTIALRTNHPSAYDMVDPRLKPRLDEWMTIHEGRQCTRKANTVLTGLGTKEGYMVVSDCYGKKTWLSFKVDNIVIKDMKVIDWGEVEESFD